MTLFIIISILFTLAHVIEEYKYDLVGEFSRFAGRTIPQPLGFFLFTPGLLFSLAVLAVLAYGSESVFLMCLMMGARVGDTIHSHWWLSFRDVAVNPGTRTTPLYVIEAITLGFLVAPCFQFIPFAIGYGAFLLAIPVIRLSGWLLNWRSL